MATMNISLPAALKEFVEEQVDQQGFANSSEFVRDLIRQAQARERVRALVVEGMTSGPGSELDDSYFERLRERAGRVAPGDA
ncbi:type II toxin-antitoxin system ParD family antitoxin [Microbacterium sp. NPDC057407]|uniref:ribbon-helix-helix domain-containing protein n=1 Tax=Microbacterium sp. NPDC057407 TaxID=3346120 RepID=UPI0036728148